MNNRRKLPAKRPDLKSVILVILFCAYYPYSWLILNKGPWSGTRWTWIKIGPALPGIMPRVAYFHHVSDELALVGMFLISVLIITLMIFLTSLRRWLFAVIAPLVFVLSVLNSLLAYALFRA